MKFGFYHSQLWKEPFCRNLQIPAPFPHPCLCAGKVRATPSNNWCNFKRLNTILNSEIFLNLIRKMKCLTDELQFCFCFCIGNTNQLHLFLHWQQIGIITDNVLVAAYTLFCLCIQVSNAVQNDYSVMLLLCSRCGKVWFWLCLRQVSMLCHFCLFFFFFNSPVTTPAHGLLGRNPSLRLRFISESTSLLALYICVTTHGPT